MNVNPELVVVYQKSNIAIAQPTEVIASKDFNMTEDRDVQIESRLSEEYARIVGQKYS